MDPMTILATAKAAAAGIKTAIAVSKDFQAIVKDLTTLRNAQNDLSKLAASPPSGWGQKMSAEEIAMQAFTAKKEAQRLEADVQNALVAEWGLNAWEEVQKEIIRIRKEQKAAAEKAAKARAAELQELMQFLWIAGSAFGAILLVGVVVVFALMRH
jgi:hypothetical protein